MRGRMKVLLGVTAFALVLSGSAAAAEMRAAPAGTAALAADIDRILTDARLTGSQAGVLVRDADTDEVLYARNTDRRLLPASNTKLFTSAAAMEVLGADHRFTTSVLAKGRRAGAVLDGDLYLRGGGDPTTLAEDYDALAKQVAAAGVRQVRGKLVADDTFFDSQRLGSDWANDDEPYYYAAQISALTLAPNTDYDSGTVIVEVRPGDAAGARAKVSLVPATGYVRIDNRATTGTTTDVSIEREHGTNTIVVSGTVAPGDETRDWATVWEPTGYAADVFRRALQRHGVSVVGRTAFAATPEGAVPVAEHRSMTLGEMLTPFMKLSNNMHAETLTKAMGRKVSNVGSWSAGLAAARTALTTLGVTTSTMRMADGSGLSRRDVITPEHVGALLAAAQSRPWFQVWYDSLPIACQSDRMVGGTLRTRMCDTPAAANVHAKTGSLTSVTALGGYVTSKDGERLIFSVMFNNHVSGNPKDLEDRIAVRLANYSRSEAATAKVAPYQPAPRKNSDPRLDDLECSWLKAC